MNTLNSPQRMTLSLLIIILAALTLAPAKPWSARGQGSNTVTTVSAASYTPGLAPDSIAAAFGTKLATQIKAAETVPLPTNLAGTTVKVNEVLAPLFFVSPTQVNYLIPTGTPPGTAQVVITSGDGTVSTGGVQVANAAPAIFTADASGKGVPAGYLLRVAANGGQTSEPIAQFINNSFAPKPILVGPPGEADFLVLFLCGVRRTALNNVKVIIAGNELTPIFAGPAPGFVGLDQINVELPPSLSGRGNIKLRVKADALISNFTEIEFGGQDSRAASATVISSSANPAVTGQNITFTAQVNPAAGTGAPTGTVIFKDSQAILGASTLNAGRATLAASLLSAGAHQIAVEYEGDNNFKASTAALSGAQNINKAATSLSVTSSKNPSVIGEEVSFNVRVTVNAPGAGAPTGSIVMTENGVMIGNKLLDSSGQATVIVALASTGARTIAASYAGDANFNSSAGTLSGNQNVNKAGTSILITSSANPANRDQVVTLTAEIRPNPAGAIIPTGLVQFKESNAPLGSPITLINGRANLAITTLALGTRSITVDYYGDPNFQSSASATFTQTITTPVLRVGGITRMAPTHASDEITINGGGFTTNPADHEVKVVDDNGKEATALVIAAKADQLRARIPFGAGSGKVKVRVLGGAEIESSDRLELSASVSGFVQEFKNGKLEAVARLPISLLEPSGRRIQTLTNNDGSFILKSVAASPLSIIEISGQAANGVSYPAQTRKFSDVLAGRDNQYKGDVDLANIIELRVNSATSTGLLLAGALINESLSAPAPASPKEVSDVITSGQVTFDTNNSTITFPGGGTGSLTLTVLDPGRTPSNLPIKYFSSTIAQITPFGATLNPGGKLTFPNSDGIPAGTPVRVFRFDQTANSQTLGQFIDIGAATISADGTKIETAVNAVTQTSYYFVSRQWPTATVIGLVSDADGRAVRRAVVSARGQSVFTGNNGGFVLANVPVITPDGANDQVTIEITFARPDGSVARTQRTITGVKANDTIQVNQEFVLPRLTANRQPQIFAPLSLVMNEGETRDFNFIVSDPDNHPFSVTVNGAPFASIAPQNSNVYTLRLAPGANSANTYSLTIRAADAPAEGVSLTAAQTVVLTVQRADNSKPTANFSSVTTNEDTPVNFTLSANNPGGGGLIYRFLSLPAHGSLGGSPPNLRYTPDPNFNGFDSLSFIVSNNLGESNVATVFFGVNPVNDAPVLALSTASSLSANAGETIKIDLTATDPDEGQTLNFSATGLPPGASFAPAATGAQFSWTPTFSQMNTYTVGFTAGDNGSPALNSAPQTLTITVGAKWGKTSGPGGGKITALFSHEKNLFAGTQGGGVFLSTSNGQSWTPVNNGLTGADRSFVSSFAVNGSNLFVSIDQNGVFRSTNDGQNWIAVNNGLTNKNVTALAVIGNNLFAATRGFDSASGVYRSTDNGQNWAPVNNGLTNRFVYTLAVSGNNLFAGTSRGVFLSVNNGDNWNEVSNGLPTTSTSDIFALVVNGTNLFAGTFGSGVYLSTNNGQSWNAVNNGLTSKFIFSLTVKGSSLFAGAGGNNTGTGAGGGVFRSTDNGQNWTPVKTGLPQDPLIASLAVNGGVLFAGTSDRTSNLVQGSGVFRSTDDGQTWNVANNGVTNSIIRVLAVIGNNLFAGTQGDGVFRSEDNGQSWAAVNSGLPSNAVVSSAAVRDTNLFVIAGSGVYLTTNLGQSWIARNDGLSGVNAIVAMGDNLFAGSLTDIFGNGGVVFRSADNGQSWEALVNSGLPGAGVNSFAVSGNTLFACTNAGLYRTANQGQSWSLVGGGLPASFVLSLFATGDSLLAISLNGVFRSTNNGQSWTDVSNTLPNARIASFAKSGQTLFLGALGSGVYFSTDNGQSWKPISDSLTNRNISSLIGSSDSIFAGSSINPNGTGAGSGVFRLPNSAQSWAETNNGLANRFTNAVGVKDGKYFAGTLGAGVFRSNDQGQSWQSAGANLPQNANVQALVVSGANLFAGLLGNGIYRSSNDGASWALSGLANQNVNALKVNNNGLIFAATDAGVFRTPTNSDSWTNAGLSNLRVVSLALSGARLLAGTYGAGVYASDDNGANWTQIGRSDNGLANLFVTALTVGADGTTLFAGTDGGGIYRSTNNGQSWAAVNNDIPQNLNVYAFAVSGNKLYAGSIYGVFLSEDNGAKWKQLNAGLLDIYVTSLAVNGKTLIAGTRIGGVFTSQIP